MANKTYQQSAWSLADLYQGFDDPAMEEDYAYLKKASDSFDALRPELKADISSERFNEILKEHEAISRIVTRIYGFASLSFAANTQDQKAQIAIGRIQQVAAELSNRALFFSLWWKDLDAENAERLMKSSGDYAYWLEQMRMFKPFTLSEAEEKIVNIKDLTGKSALEMLYDTITNAYVFNVEVDGKEQKLTRGELMALVRTPDPDLRAAAYQELYRVYGEAAPVLGQIYQAIVRDWRNENVQLRGFDSPIAVRNLGNDLPDEVINTLIEVTRKNIGIFHRVFKLKAKLLGMEKLRRYDIYAPIGKSDKKYSFQEAIDLTFEAYKRFDERFLQQAKRVFDDGHIDSEVRKGKQGGAFCATILPELSPWVLLNFQGKVDDVSTMAHELGHAVHSMMAEDHTLFTQNACLPLAETASTFGEMTLNDLLIEKDPSPAVQRDVLFAELDGAWATIIRQIYFAIFERDAHEMIAKGASVDELNAAYFENLKEQFGDAVELSKEFQYEWVSIPHIYSTPFYVYAYAFGQLLVYALYKRYLEEGESFKPKYMRILSAGGSVASMELLKEAGMDVSTAAFWQGGFDVIAEKVTRLEQLSE
jgi:oligoendopeptidase F